MVKDLSKTPSLCKARQKNISSKGEHGRRHIAHNINKMMVRHFKTDGDVIIDEHNTVTGKESMKCDFLLLNDDIQRAELKWMEPRKGEKPIIVNGKRIKQRYIKSGCFYEEDI